MNTNHFCPDFADRGCAPYNSSSGNSGTEIRGGLFDLAAADPYSQDETTRIWWSLLVSAGVGGREWSLPGPIGSSRHLYPPKGRLL